MGKDQKEPKKKTSPIPFVAIFLIALVGCYYSILLIDVHRIVHSGSGETTGCDYSDELSCSPVALDDWSSVLGVPTAAWALMAYAVVALLSLTGIRRRVFPNGPGGLMLLIASCSFLFGLFLIYRMAYVIEAWCVKCLVLDGVNLGFLLCSLWAALSRGIVRSVQEDFKTLAENRPAAIAIIGGPALAALLVLFSYPTRATQPTEPDADIQLPDGGFESPTGEINLEGAPSKGPRNAMIEIIEFSDYECPFCSFAHDEFREVVEENPTKVRFYHFHHPLDMACNNAIRRPFHHHACIASRAAVCAQERNKFWELSDLLFEHGRRLNESKIDSLIGEVGLDLEEMHSCMDGDRAADRVQFDLEQSKSVPVTGTPTFVINGKVVSGLHRGMYRRLLQKLLENDGRWPER